jgi:hypothetical protein
VVPSLAEELLKARLEKLGYSVKVHATLQGRSGASHGFSLCGEGRGKDRFVIDIEGSGRPAAFSLVSLRAKAFDTGVCGLFLVTDSPMDREARQLAELYNVRVITPRISIGELKRQLQSLPMHITPRPQAREMQGQRAQMRQGLRSW